MLKVEAPSTHQTVPSESADPSWIAFDQVSLLQFLHHDRRPTFVLDLQNTLSDTDVFISASYVNPAMRERRSLIGLLDGHDLKTVSTSKQDYHDFQKWVQGVGGDSSATSFQFAGFDWFCTTLMARWRVFIAETVQNPCNCAVREPMSTTKPSSIPTSDAPSSEDHAQGDISSRNSRPSREGFTSNTDKSLHPLLRARHFFAGESQAIENEMDVDHVTGTSASEQQIGFDKDASANSAFGMWSDIRIAKRNADLLAKISAFETVGISITDIDGTIVFANDAWYNICGIPHGPTDAASWMSIFGPTEIPKIADVWKSITTEKKPGTFQTPLKWRWDSAAATNSGMADFPVWIAVWAYPDVSVDGEIIGCCTVLTDITQQKWAERLIEQQLADAVERAKVLEQLSNDLALSESRFRRISDSMPHGVFICNVHGNMLYTNDAYTAIFPTSSDPTLAEPWWSNIPQEELARAQEIWRRLREDRVKVSFEMSILVPSNSSSAKIPRYMTCSSYPELDENGEIKHITGTITDINHLKLAERTQGARADNAEESKRQLEHFIDMTSHEIRNPLSAIVHSAEEILSSLQDPETVTAATIKSTIEMVETIMDCTNHSTRIVDDILVVSKLDSGLLKIAPTPVHFTSAVGKCLKMFAGEMRAADISSSLTIDKSFAEHKIEWVCLDINRMLQIVVNLITNAIKFTRLEDFRQINTHLSASLERPTSKPDPNGLQFLAPESKSSVAFPETVGIKEEVVYITVSVTDTGCGLSPSEQKNLFQRFSQAGKRTHIKYGGTGLGLFISRQLCEMQGGQIGLQSVSGKGSLFSFYIEARKSNPPETGVSNHGLADVRFGVQKARTFPLRTDSGIVTSENTTSSSFKQTILLVEDNLVNQKVVSKMLRNKGFTVLIANHGLEALDHIRNSSLFSGALTTALPISLILMDVEMPVMDGLTCARRIRKMADTGELRYHVPMVAITANARQEQINQAKVAGMDDVVTKPFRTDQLLSVMTRLWDQCPV